ncbi:putative lipoprotein [Burkholderia pseudomallei MSHR7334]|nr:putative lipoprotein [Burkholderia pseudomallei MSHR7334]
MFDRGAVQASLTVGRKAVSRLTLALTGVWLAGCVRFAHVCRLSSSWVSRFGRRMLTLAVLARSLGGLAASSAARGTAGGARTRYFPFMDRLAVR